MSGEEDKYILKPPPLAYQPKGGMGYEFFRFMKLYRNNVAQHIAETNEKDTFDSLLSRCIRAAIKIKSQGLAQKDLICLCSYNHLNSCVPFIASLFLGIKVTSLDPTLSSDDTSYLLQKVPPAIIFLVPEAINLIENSVKMAGIKCKLVIFGESDKHQQFMEYLIPSDKEKNFRPVNVSPEETAVIFFSSGTTGFPKGICQSHYALLAQGMNIIIFLAPIQGIEMYKAGRPDDIDTSSLLCLLTGGGSIPQKQLISLRDLLPGTYISQAYGQTEVAGVLSNFKMNDVKDALRLHYKPSSCGRPINGIWYKIVDPETEKTLGPNQQGELRVKSRFTMNGYYNLDSSEAFDSDGWLKTGDIVYYDEDQCFYVVDRIKEMLKYKSWHIAPAILENVLHNHPSVRRAVVIGIPHEEDGDHPMAVVILNNPEDPVTAEEIENYVASRVQERQKLRAGVKFVASVPMTPSGKVKRQVLRKMILAGQI